MSDSYGRRIVSQKDRAKKKAVQRSAPAWNRDRMNETHRKGKRGAKKQVRRARRRLDKCEECS